MKFTLEITLGNEAMQSADDVLDAFKESVERLWEPGADLMQGDSGRLMDENGNTVGSWRVTE